MKKQLTGLLTTLLTVSLVLSSCGSAGTESTLTGETKETEITSASAETAEGSSEAQTTETEKTTAETTLPEPTTLSKEEIYEKVEEALQEAEELGFCQKAMTVLTEASILYDDLRLKAAELALKAQQTKLKSVSKWEGRGDTAEEAEENLNYFGSKTSEKGRTEYEYDTRGNLIREKKYDSRYSTNIKSIMQYSYDYAGNRIEESKLLGSMIPVTRDVYEYDADGHKTFRIHYENEVTASTAEYNADEKPVLTTTYTSGEPTVLTDYEYNEYGDLLSAVQKDPDGNVLNTIEREYVYDDQGRITAYTEELNGKENGSLSLVWNEDGTHTEVQNDANGYRDEILYDESDREISEKTYRPDGTLIYFVTYEYEKDRLVRSTEGFRENVVSTEYSYIYDHEGQLINEIHIDYEDDGSVSYVANEQTEYEYMEIPLPEDENEMPGIPIEFVDYEELISSNRGENAVSYRLETNYTDVHWYGTEVENWKREDYDAEGELIWTVTMTLNSDNRLSSLPDKERIEYKAVFDEKGNPTVYYSYRDGMVHICEYDEDGRLVSEIQGFLEDDLPEEFGPDIPYTFRYRYAYAYDKQGNEILRETFNEEDQKIIIREQKFNQNNQILESKSYGLDENGEKDNPSVAEYEYDEYGNMTSYVVTLSSGEIYISKKNSYTYDDEGRMLSQYSLSDDIYDLYETNYFEFEYNEEGLLIQKISYYMDENGAKAKTGWSVYKYGTFQEQD